MQEKGGLWNEKCLQDSKPCFRDSVAARNGEASRKAKEGGTIVNRRFVLLNIRSFVLVSLVFRRASHNGTVSDVGISACRVVPGPALAAIGYDGANGD